MTRMTKNTKTPNRASNEDTARPRTRKGAVLATDPVTLPRVPEHHYGNQRHVGALQAGDIVYIGTQHKLSTVEIAAIRPSKTMPGRELELHVLAIDLHHDGERYEKREQLVLIADVNARIAVRQG